MLSSAMLRCLELAVVVIEGEYDFVDDGSTRRRGHETMADTDVVSLTLLLPRGVTRSFPRWREICDAWSVRPLPRGVGLTPQLVAKVLADAMREGLLVFDNDSDLDLLVLSVLAVEAGPDTGPGPGDDLMTEVEAALDLLPPLED